MRKYAIIIVIFAMASCKKELTSNDNLASSHLNENTAIHSTEYIPQFFHWQGSEVNPCNGETIAVDGWISLTYRLMSNENHPTGMWNYRARFTALGSMGTVYSVKYLENESTSINGDNEEYTEVAKIRFSAGRYSFVTNQKIHIVLDANGAKVNFSDLDSQWNCSK